MCGELKEETGLLRHDHDEHVHPTRSTWRASGSRTGTATGIRAGRYGDEDMPVVQWGVAHGAAGVWKVQVYWEGGRVGHTPRAARTAI